MSPRLTEIDSNILEAQFAEVVSTIETIRQAVSVLAPEELTETVRDITTNEGKLEGIFNELVSQLKTNLQRFDINYSSGNKYAIKQGAQLISTNLSDLASASSKLAVTLESSGHTDHLYGKDAERSTITNINGEVMVRGPWR